MKWLRGASAVLAVMLLALATPQRVLANDGPDLTGIWEVVGDTRLYGHFRFFVDIRPMRFSSGRSGWEAVKRTDTRNVPARELHFRGYVDTLRVRGSVRHLLFAEVQVAFPGFVSPRMEEHIFEIAPGSVELSTEVSSVILDSVDARGNESLGSDRWTYRKWDLHSFRIQAPEVRDFTFHARAKELRAEIDREQRQLHDLDERIAAREAELAGVIADDRAGAEAARLLKAKNAALERFMDVRKSKPPDPPPVHERLRPMNDHLRYLRSEKAGVEDRIVALNGGQARERDRLLARLASIDRQIADARAAIRRIASEEGIELPRASAPRAPSPERIAEAERAYEHAFRQWYEQAGRNSDRPRRIAEIGADLDRLRGEAAGLREAIAEKGARMKGYENGRQIAGVIVAVEEGAQAGRAVPGPVVLEVIPSDADLDLAEIRKEYETRRDEFHEIERIRADNFARFNAISAEISDLRETLVVKIMNSAYKQAAVELVGNLASAAVSGATGGLAGAVADAVFTVAWTCAWNEDCVAFTNYDETRMEQVFEERRAELLARDSIDENASCSFLPGLEPVDDAGNRLSEWVRAPKADRSDEPVLRAVEVSGSAQRVDISNGVMTTMGAFAMSVREGALVAGEEQFRVWFEGRIRDMLVQKHANVLLREAQMRSIRASLVRTSEEVFWAEVSHTARSAMVDAARRVLADPNASAAAAANAQQILQQYWPMVRDAELLGRIDVRKGFERFEALDSAIRSQTDELARLEGKLAKVSGALRTKIALAGLNVVAGVAIGLTKSALQSTFKEDERDHWARVFAKQIEASFHFKAYQRASCLYWARLDQIAWLQRFYAPLFFAYDQNKDLKVLTDRTFTDDQSLLVYVSTRSGDFGLGSRTRIGGVACRRISANACRIDAGEWAQLGERRPTLEFVIDLEPRAD